MADRRPIPEGIRPFGPDSNCNLELCDVEWSVYRYRPNLGVNIMFIALYALALACHLALGIRWKSWWFMAFMISGCLVEIIGYAGRVMLYNNPFNYAGFMTQIVCITSGPVFYTAAIYITLSKAISHFSPDISRIRPSLFYWIFIPADMICLALQGAGGGLSTSTRGASQKGIDLALAGLSLQVIVIVAFVAFFIDYMIRYFRSGRATAFGIKMKLFFGFLTAAILLILARCAYRCYELSEGYTGTLITEENLFIGLEGVLIVISVFALCVGHPGLVFGAVSAAARGEKDAGGENGVVSESS